MTRVCDVIGMVALKFVIETAGQSLAGTHIPGTEAAKRDALRRAGLAQTPG